MEISGYRVTRSFGIGRGIGVRYDATELAVEVTEVPAYGTAVYAEVYRAQTKLAGSNRGCGRNGSLWKPIRRRYRTLSAIRCRDPERS